MLVVMVPRVRVHKNSTDIALDVFKKCSVAVKVKADSSNRPHFLWVYRGNNPRGMFGEHEKNL